MWTVALAVDLRYQDPESADEWIAGLLFDRTDPVVLFRTDSVSIAMHDQWMGMYGIMACWTSIRAWHRRRRYLDPCRDSVLAQWRSLSLDNADRLFERCSLWPVSLRNQRKKAEISLCTLDHFRIYSDRNSLSVERMKHKYERTVDHHRTENEV